MAINVTELTTGNEYTESVYSEPQLIGECTGEYILRLLNNYVVVDGGHFYFGQHIAKQRNVTFGVFKRSYIGYYAGTKTVTGSGTQYLLEKDGQYEHLSYNSHFSLQMAS